MDNLMLYYGGGINMENTIKLTQTLKNRDQNMKFFKLLSKLIISVVLFSFLVIIVVSFIVFPILFCSLIIFSKFELGDLNGLFLNCEFISIYFSHGVLVWFEIIPYNERLNP